MSSFNEAFEADRRNIEVLTNLMKLHMDLIVNAAEYKDKLDTEAMLQFRDMDKLTLKLIKRNSEQLGLSM